MKPGRDVRPLSWNMAAKYCQVTDGVADISCRCLSDSANYAVYYGFYMSSAGCIFLCHDRKQAFPRP